ncbi:EXS family-domain-containing protein [Mycena belliarum]|uniref:EXS family-domain-containing protein n=1 Tax=Mycena belliarum TaxID=1033014 RepID=A0AAD6XJX0_9AGAR|nr:EXS family-domain-containing protein [Mycena belliae]
MSDYTEIPIVLSFPLPFRVLVLTGLGILGWASNLHGLDVLGVDVVAAMDLRVDASGAHSHLPPHLSGGAKPPSHPSVIYTAVYRLWAVYSIWCFCSWATFRYLTYGNMRLVDAFGYIPAISALVVLLVLFLPVDTFYKRERDKFLHAIRRCLFTSMDGPIYFADVVFADIFTSFAKVLGDVWLSACMLLPGNTLFSTPADGEWLRWVLPTIMSLPYLVRLKQCVIEYSLPTNESRRPLFNALKYATSFPVIYLSAAQRIVVSELVREKGNDIAKEAWHGEHRLFRLWLLAAAVNSLYSFWWDVTNDWGLSLLKLDNASGDRPPPPRRLLLPHRQSDLPQLSRTSTSTSEDAVTTTATNHQRQPYPGLRSVLLFPLPVYPLVVFLNLILRLTWSIKLSSHLHSKTDGSVTIFWLEMAEVLRRWMWVYVRVEWEVIKKTRHGSRRDSLLDEFSGDEMDAEYEMVPRTADDERLGRVP